VAKCGYWKEEVETSALVPSRQVSWEVEEINVRVDPVRLSISKCMGRLKGRSALRMFRVVGIQDAVLTGAIIF
jgi:hypothetical protein